MTEPTLADLTRIWTTAVENAADAVKATARAERDVITARNDEQRTKLAERDAWAKLQEYRGRAGVGPAERPAHMAGTPSA